MDCQALHEPKIDSKIANKTWFMAGYVHLAIKNYRRKDSIELVNACHEAKFSKIVFLSRNISNYKVSFCMIHRQKSDTFEVM